MKFILIICLSVFVMSANAAFFLTEGKDAELKYSNVDPRSIATNIDFSGWTKVKEVWLGANVISSARYINPFNDFSNAHKVSLAAAYAIHNERNVDIYVNPRYGTQILYLCFDGEDINESSYNENDIVFADLQAKHFRIEEESLYLHGMRLYLTNIEEVINSIKIAADQNMLINLKINRKHFDDSLSGEINLIGQ